MYSSMWRGSGNGGGGSVDYSRVVEKIAVIPSVETATVGKVYMYMGESNATYTHGYIYECVATQTASDVAFSGSIITSWSVADFVAYLQEGGSAYNEVTHGTLTYDASGGLWDLVGYDANGIKVLSFHEYTEDLEDFGCVFESSTHQDGDNCTFTMTTTESGKKWKRLDVQPAGGSGGGAVDSVNGKTGVVVLDATDVNALPDSTKYVASASWTIDSSTYVMTLQLKDQDNNNLGQAQTIDLPLESVVVNGSYDSTNKKIVLTLQNGNTIDIPVADLVNGLQTEITAQNKLDADLVDDSTSTNKFVTASDKTTWSGKQDALVSGTNIKTIDGNSVLGSGNLELSTYLTYPAGWTTNSTTKAFCDGIAADTTAVKGKAYLGEVTCSDLPASISNAEVVVEIMDGTTAQDKKIVLSLKSGNVAPYAWQYVYWDNGTNVSGWQTWATAAQGAKADTAVQPADLATVATTGAYSDLSGTPTIPEPIQVSTLPTASADELGNIYQFTGTTDATYTNGYFYKCVSDGQQPATYSWTQVNVQPSSGGVSDVTVNGTSVVSGGVAAITCATIDDTSTSSLTATWSASKLNTTIGNIESLLAAI